MQHRHSRALFVDAFENVDLAAVWPVGTVEPVGRPSTATSGHVLYIEDEEATIVVSLTLDPHCAPPGARCDAAVVHSHEDLARGGDTRERCASRDIAVHVGDVAVSGLWQQATLDYYCVRERRAIGAYVWSVEEVEAIKEVVA